MLSNRLDRSPSSVAATLILFNFLSLTGTQASPPVEHLLSTNQTRQFDLTNSTHLILIENSTHLSELELNKALKNVNHTHDNNLVGLDLASFAWFKMEQEYERHIQTRINRSRPLIEQLLRESEVSSDCQVAISHWLDHLFHLGRWASVMWNSWGEFPPTGLFEGSFTDLGSYRSCLNIKSNKYIGQPQYCTLDYQPLVPARPRFHSIFKRVLDIDLELNQLVDPNRERSRLNKHKLDKFSPEIRDATHLRTLHTGIMIEFARKAHFFYYLKLRIGSCWPTKCSRQDIQNISRMAGARMALQASPTFCITKSDRFSFKINNYQLSAILILSALATITILASILDTVQSLAAFFGFENLATRCERIEHYLELCSLRRNCRRLFLVSACVSMTATAREISQGKERKNVARQLTCLHGLRFISMIWVIYGHTLLNTDYQSFTHAYRVLENDLANFFVLPTLIPNYSVDTFFVISGLLSAYIIFSLDIKFNGLLYTVARYMRLTPQLIIIILMFFLLPLMGDGPLYRQFTDVHAERCFKNFWLNLLYLQSYINRKELCIIPSWWLSIEMTFHLLSLGIIYLLIKRPKLGLIINFLIPLILTLVGSYIHYTNGFAIQYLPSVPQKYEVELEQTQWFFHRPYPHAASYFIGLALGYVLAKRLVKKMNRFQSLLGWSVCCFGFVISLWGTYYWNLGVPYTQIQATVYYNLCQILWPISIAWIILACSTGYGGPINTILSARFFVPVGRVTYMTYLSHILIVYYYAASVHQTMEPSGLNLVSVR